MFSVNPDYKNYVRYKNRKKVLYFKVIHTIYG